jgi:hypothetical protein
MCGEWISHFHLFTYILIALYAFLFSKNAFDPVYLLITYVTVTHWTFYDGECLFTYMHKRNQDPNYTPGKNVESNEFEKTYGIPNETMKIITFLQTVLWMIGTYFVLKRNRFPLSMSISFISLFAIYYIARLMIKEPYKNEHFLIIQEIIKYALLLYGIILWYTLYTRSKC